MKSKATPKTSKSTSKKAIKPPTFDCGFCKKSFQTEEVLISHACEKRRRWLFKDEKDVKIGFQAYQLFFKKSFTGLNRRSHDRTYEDFMNSNYYAGFVRFGKFVLEVNVVDPMNYVEFLVKNDIKLKDWTLDSVYDIWLREVGKKEDIFRALERNILLMQQWSQDTGEDWTDFFRKVNPQLATKWIKNGRISPWLLYSGFGDDLFSRMSDEQLNFLTELLDPQYWLLRLEQEITYVRDVQHTLRQNGV